jgi:hypothetical protein
LAKVLAGNKDGLACIFTERVLRQYVQRQTSALHLHLTQVMTYAVTQVFAQVRKTPKPYGGDVKKATDAMKRVAFDVFDIRYS